LTSGRIERRGRARVVHETSWSHETVLAADAGSAARARTFVVDHLVEHRLLYLVDDVRLVASELATNAVVHAQTAFTVILEGHPDSVLLTVRDGSQTVPALPRPPPARESGTTGRGLVIVNLSSHAWGVAGEEDSGKSVWARFQLRSRAVS
jgi:anti-sigma regulatory factor (Ser/Thr protein kinase)